MQRYASPLWERHRPWYGAEVLERRSRASPGSDRQWAMEHPSVRHERICFVEADEWV